METVHESTVHLDLYTRFWYRRFFYLGARLRLGLPLLQRQVLHAKESLAPSVDELVHDGADGEYTSDDCAHRSDEVCERHPLLSLLHEERVELVDKKYARKTRELIFAYEHVLSTLCY